MKKLILKEGIVIGSMTIEQGQVNIPEGAISYDVDDNSLININWTYSENDGQYEFEPPAFIPPKVSPVQFKLLFTSMERVAIHEARKTDPTVDDFFDIVDDLRLEYVDLSLPSVQGALHYFAAISLITDDRIPQILSGNVM